MNFSQAFNELWHTTGLANFGLGQALMLVIGCVLLYLAIRKGFEPLLLLPIGFGCILSNVPLAGITDEAPPVEEFSFFVAHGISEANVTDLLSKKDLELWVERYEKEQTGLPARDKKTGEFTPAFRKYLYRHRDLFCREENHKQLVEAFNRWNRQQALLRGEKHVKEYAPHDGFLMTIYKTGVANELFPLIIFMGVGAMTDFGPLIANPKTALLGAAAQFGIFSTLIGALLLSRWVPGINFNLQDAASIGIIGGADGPTSIYTASKLAPHLLGAIAVAAYSYMALVPIIQPPIMKLFTSEEERKIEMKQLRHVAKIEKILFPLLVFFLCAVLLPSACPLIGALMFGNLARESGVVDRLSNTMQNALINIVTIFLGLSVGMKLAHDKFLRLETLGILFLGLIAFSFGTAAGVIFGKIMNKFSKDPINPLIGAAGVSAVPMAARVANKVGQEENPHNFLLMHAMGPNVAGVIGSAVAAGVLIALCGG
ncbi:MAG: sodium ion-translocating decarboxylase subunit beta [Lentisphaerae bacterium]|nr:MAG: sodium ion-translocating decarboxylase subunit beta [Lentisphaerota bacterium]